MTLKHFGICYTERTYTSNIYLNSVPKHFKLYCSGFIFYNKIKLLNTAYETERVLLFPLPAHLPQAPLKKKSYL